jgi:hypothetical protein
MIELDADWRIVSDPHQYTLQRRRTKPTEKKSWESVSYHCQLERAVSDYFERARRASDARSWIALLTEERTRRERLCAALRDALSFELGVR